MASFLDSDGTLPVTLLRRLTVDGVITCLPDALLDGFGSLSDDPCLWLCPEGIEGSSLFGTFFFRLNSVAEEDPLELEATAAAAFFFFVFFTGAACIVWLTRRSDATAVCTIALAFLACFFRFVGPGVWLGTTAFSFVTGT